MNLLNDIYYSKDYISLYLKEKEEIFEFLYKDGDYIFYNLAIKISFHSICQFALRRQ